MDHPAHIAFIDAHPEGDRSADDQRLIVDEVRLHLSPPVGAESRVVGFGIVARLAEFVGEVLGLLAAQAVHDARLPGALADEAHDLLAPLLSGPYFQAQVGSVKRGDELLSLRNTELLGHIATGQPIGRRGQGQHGYLPEGGLELLEHRVLRTEVMPPGRDTVRLVDGKQTDAPPAQEGEKAR